MKKIALLLVLGLSLAGCNSQTLQLLTGTLNNPVTPKMLYTAENTALVVFAGLNAYKQACIQKLVPQNCRTVIASIQVRTRKLPPLLADLRAFVKNNEQVNAITAYNTVVLILNDVNAIAAANKVQVQ